MWDGQNVFDDASAFAGGWRLHECVARRLRRGRTVPVVVGLNHGGGMRLRELSPFPTPLGEPLLEPLLAWVCDRLIPLLRKEFGTQEHPAGTTVGGSSMGGLAALFAHLRRPDVLGGAWCMSPSVFSGEGGSLYTTVQKTPKPWTTRVYLDAGGREAGGKLLKATQGIALLLRARGWSRKELLWWPVKTGQHNERHWRRRSARAMRFFYDP
jgi:enterochelin esterase-like enzyme